MVRAVWWDGEGFCSTTLDIDVIGAAHGAPAQLPCSDRNTWPPALPRHQRSMPFCCITSTPNLTNVRNHPFPTPARSALIRAWLMTQGYDCITTFYPIHRRERSEENLVSLQKSSRCQDTPSTRAGTLHACCAIPRRETPVPRKRKRCAICAAGPLHTSPQPTERLSKLPLAPSPCRSQ